MALYRRTLTTSPSISSALRKLFPSSNSATAAAAAVRSFSALPEPSLETIDSPHSSYTWLLHPSQNLYSVEHADLPVRPKSEVINPVNATRCVGSTRGWLVLTDPKDGSLYLSNPFSNGKYIKLPDNIKSSVMTHFVLTSSDPESHKYCRLMAISKNLKNSKPQIVYCRPGKDDEWINGPSYNGLYYHYDQLVYSHKVRLLYTLSNDQFCLKGYDPSSFHCGVHFLYQDYLKKNMKYTKAEKYLRDQCKSRHYFLIDNASGEALLVIKHYAEHVVEEDGTILPEDPTGYFPYRTQTFDVFSFRKNEKLKSIGDRVIFLGLNEAFILDGSKHKGLQGDSIYFLDDFLVKTYFKGLPFGGHDMGVFSLKNDCIIDNKSCSFFDGLQGKRIEEPMFWVAPSTKLVSNK